MDGGAWQSGVDFDNGRNFQKSRPQAQNLGGGGTPPAIYNSPAEPSSGDTSVFGRVSVSLRVAQIVLTLISFALMVTNKVKTPVYDSRGYLDGYEEHKFSDIKSYIGVLSVDIIACLYAAVQLVHSIGQASGDGSFISSPTMSASTITFVLDQVVAYGLMGAAAAAASFAAALQDAHFCDTLSKFCQKGEASIAMCFFAFICFGLSAVLYPVRLLRVFKS